ncbi:DUF480 domain-containing protein [Iamia majanohamensis]|uniref:DUF480 domain-containing protein n=1 Tax=Iamia majanohamensis TaxID=467976 RepID=A0AAE9Y9W3_9ACTN|nr:DUF480 domain-containing protein [Iamia majanohamensis]WCO68506.1 DUF480 domain-containing protein [Iamia majanohamensis]
MDLVLSPAEVRVLGSLLEKERTVPATYPMTLNGLVTACNQSSSRDPVTDLSEHQVEAALDRLKAQHLVRKVLPTTGSRVVKYRQVAQDALTVDDPQRAVLTVLLLRGPQTPQELKVRTERIHPFADAGEVEATLEDMAGWGEPLVRLLPRAPGQRDARWAHLLAGEPADPTGGTTAGADGATTAAGGGPSPEGGTAAPAPDPAVHRELAPLAGRWTGSGQGHYPTIDGFSYHERIELVPVAGKPVLAYRSTTTASDDGRGLHAESGFLRRVGDGAVELVVAGAPGVAETCAGLVEVGATGVEVALVSETVVGTPTAKEVTATERTYRVEGDVLTYDLAMAAVGEPLTHHLHATLRRA